MRNFVAAKSFVQEWWKSVTSGKSVLQTLFKLALAAYFGIALIPNQRYELIARRDGLAVLSFSVEAVDAIFAVALAVVVLYCAGIAKARMFTARIVIGDELSIDSKTNAARFEVSCKGSGSIDVMATVEEVRSWSGELLQNSEMRGLILGWTRRPGEKSVRLTERSPPHSVTLFTYEGYNLYIFGFNDKAYISSEMDVYDVSVKVRLYADNCEPVYRWFGIHGDENDYHPHSQLDLPEFCR